MIENPDAASGLIYHYTSGDGLISILRSKQLWATDVAHLNDLQEFELAFLDVAEMLLKMSEEQDAAGDEWLAGQLRTGRLNVLDYPGGTRFGPFVTCFCKDGDLLSQWRGYAKGGYAIGFDREILSGLEFRSSGSFLPLVEVLYGNDGKDQMLRELRSTVANAAKTGGADQLIHATLRGLVSVKDGGFSEEEELRLIALPTGRYDERFRTKPNGMIAPYVEIDFPVTAVREIVIGPGAFDRADVRPATPWEGGALPRLHPPIDAIYRMLGSFGFSGVVPRLSSIPYRN